MARLATFFMPVLESSTPESSCFREYRSRKPYTRHRRDGLFVLHSQVRIGLAKFPAYFPLAVLDVRATRSWARFRLHQSLLQGCNITSPRRQAERGGRTEMS
ncbi:hypothetical protein NDU88_007513 [Pleurodeles waltl]|uniref:Uncharacterized protein n=1 Tax=Pleurodeles waltl TaxID=8319 RepID=A0AAV7U1N7_PLEWA|nr:hypothetical protein NDU88_007513 [Pleurodeles waltl]